MRLTKQLLKKTKDSFLRRVKEIEAIPEDKLQAELKRCFPGITIEDASPRQCVQILIKDAFELSFPDHWWY